MPSIPVGMPVQYRNVMGEGCPGQVLRNTIYDEALIDYVIYFDSSDGKWKVSPPGIVQDDGLETNNSWRPVPDWTAPVALKRRESEIERKELT